MDTSIIIVIIILVATVAMLIFELVRIDMVAIISMLALGWSGMVSPEEMISGFSSNAVIAMMAVMIMGRGIARTGLMNRFSRKVVKKAGTDRKRIIGFMSLSIGVISGFIQNIGAAVLFLPSILDVARRSKLPASYFVMPIGFAAILGGTLSMVGSGHLILVNDLLINAGLEPYYLFSVTPIGSILLISGIVFFYLFGKHLLPHSKIPDENFTDQEKLIEELELPGKMQYFTIPVNSYLHAKTTEGSGIWEKYNINIIGITEGKDMIYAPWREAKFRAGQTLALLGKEENIARMVTDYNLIPAPRLKPFTRLNDPVESGFAEVIFRPRSDAIGQKFRDYAFRRKFAVEPLRLLSKGEEMRGDFSDHRISPGDIIIVYGLWEKIREVKDTVDFVVATPFKAEEKDDSKTLTAMLCFIFSIGLALAGFPISMAFFTGATAMILTRVLSIQQAYKAIDWKIVFLLAGLIPLGIAMQKSGTAVFLAEELMSLVSGSHSFYLILAIGIISTVFSLFMSNVGAIVVLAPLVIGMAEIGDMDPRPLVLMAAVCVSNSFILPTHQVNALMMTAGGYRNKDYFKAGGAISLLFLAITVSFFYFVFF